MWFEELPERCPPTDAKTPDGQEYFRLIENEIIESDDFISHRKIWPNKAFHVSECRARSVSVYSDIEECRAIKKLPAHKQKKIAKVILKKDDGYIKQTGQNKEHYSWWRTRSFNYETSTALVA
ncbi:hypothetical protein [Shewanella algae]|uniref:hypothetical protein n=1 Tax=Shewanella algae TaxID=38313 RepID=UPI0031F4C644